MNKLLDLYCKMLYFCKGKPTTLSTLSNWELEGILLHINKYPQGLLNGYDKLLYINAVNYILKYRKDCKNYVLISLETKLANKSFDKAELLTKIILNSMINTEKKSSKKLKIII